MATRAKKSPARSAQTSAVKAPKPIEYTKEQELHAYGEMLLIRRFEEKASSTAWVSLAVSAISISVRKLL